MKRFNLWKNVEKGYNVVFVTDGNKKETIINPPVELVREIETSGKLETKTLTGLICIIMEK